VLRVATKPLLALIVIVDAVVVTKVVLGFDAVNNAVGSAGLGASVADLQEEAPLTTVGGTLRDQLPEWWLMAPKPWTEEEGDGARSATKRDTKDRRPANQRGGDGADPTAAAASGSFDGTVIGTGSSSGPSAGDGGGSTDGSSGSDSGSGSGDSSGGDSGGSGSGSGGSSETDSGGSGSGTGPGGSDPDGGGGDSTGGDGDGSTGGGGGG
jgi:hypothetical protein